MYGRLSGVMFPILLIALVAAGVWGYKEHQDKNSVLIKAENQYQRAFHDLSFHMDKLQTELGNTMAVNSTANDFYRKEMINVWRLTSEAQNEVSQLPLALLPFSKTDEFLGNLASFTYQTSVRDLSKKPLDDNELKTLKELYNRSKEISSELRGVQSKTIKDNLRWMDVEMALATESSNNDNVIIDGFKKVDKKVAEYSELNWGPSMKELFAARSEKAPAGLDVNADEVKKKATEFFGIKDGNSLKVKENAPGTEYSSFTVTGKDPESGADFQMDFTKKGGHMIWYTINRDSKSKDLSMEQAREIAEEYLAEHNYKDLTAINFDEYQNMATYTFVKKQGDVLIYPQKVIAKVALDNGEITGLEATDYIYRQKDRQIKQPKLTAQEAKKSISPDFQVSEEARAVIRNDAEQEVDCYQLTGKIGGTLYRIYVNSENGYEEKIETIGPVETEGTK